MVTLFLPVLAVAAGILSFTSPCCLPLLPGYASYISGLPVSDLGERAARRLTLWASLLFVAGFSLVFVLLGVSFTLVGSLVLRHVPLITRVAGGVIIAMGLAMIGVLRVPAMSRERRFDLARLPSGPRGAFPLGMAFAFGWAPCIGPVLATILTAAAATQTVAWGGVLLLLYSLGLGIPFVLLALGMTRAKGTLTWLRRNGRRIEIIGGAMLVGVGVLFVSGVWRSFFLPLQTKFAEFGWPPI